MKILVDSNVLCRLSREDDPQYRAARDAVDALLRQRHELVITPQVEREFWVVATRPRDRNGLGLTPSEAAKQYEKLDEVFGYQADLPGVQNEWHRLVRAYGVSGKEAHDAGHVAAMSVHGINHVLTFNVRDFDRFRDRLTILQPERVVERTPDRDRGDDFDR